MTFFVTFGQRYHREPHPTFPQAHPDGWVEIIAPNYATAWQITQDHLGNHFAFIYEEEQLEKPFYPLGCLEKFTK
jgi:hypothetical protein